MANPRSSPSSKSNSSNNSIGQPPSTTPPPPQITLRDLCCILCCPPLPSSIASKVAFMPPKCSYRIVPGADGGRATLHLDPSQQAFWPFGEDELRQSVAAFFAPTKRGNRIACIFIRPYGETQHFTLLISNPNAIDIGRECSSYFTLAAMLRCNVMAYDYSGYGQSTGSPSEKNIYADLGAAFKSLQKRYRIPAERVILYGLSIGTVPSIDLASKNSRFAGLILHAPLLSGLRVLCPSTRRTWCCDAFPSIDKIQHVRCPTLIVHGTEDKIIGVSHGVVLHSMCNNTVKPMWVPGRGHNDLITLEYVERLDTFIHRQIAENRQKMQQKAKKNGNDKNGQN